MIATAPGDSMMVNKQNILELADLSISSATVALNWAVCIKVAAKGRPKQRWTTLVILGHRRIYDLNSGFSDIWVTNVFDSFTPNLASYLA